MMTCLDVILIFILVIEIMITFYCFDVIKLHKMRMEE